MTASVPDPQSGRPNQPVPADAAASRPLGPGRVPYWLRAGAVFGAILAAGILIGWWIPAFVGGLMFVLFMHELGHFLAARASGMKVSEFFLGFGPRIFAFRRGETEYGLKAIPAGAYVRIAGMTNLEVIDPALEERTYRAQPYWQRMVTICAGSAMHFAMAIAATIVLFGAYDYTGFHRPWQVARVVDNSSAAEIGVEPGDRIVRFAGQDFDTWSEFGEVVSTTNLGPVAVVVERDGQQLELVGELGARPSDVVQSGFGLHLAHAIDNEPWIVTGAVNGSGAEQFGLRPGDGLLAVGDVIDPDPLDLGLALRAAEHDEITIHVARNGQVVPLTGTVELDTRVNMRGFLGVQREDVAPKDHSWPAAVGLAFKDFAAVVEANVEGIAELVNPARLLAEPDQVAPVATAQPPTAAPEPNECGRPVSLIGLACLISHSESFDQVLFLFMAVNVFVGLFNLVPILPLDGGHAAIATWERLRQLFGSPDYRVDAAKLVPITWVAISALVGLGLWAVATDISAW